jgi:hypothetical protein
MRISLRSRSSQRFIHSIIACRVILDIRGQALCEDLTIADSGMLDTSVHMPTTFTAGMDDQDEAIHRTTSTGKRAKVVVLVRDETSSTAIER